MMQLLIPKFLLSSSVSIQHLCSRETFSIPVDRKSWKPRLQPSSHREISIISLLQRLFEIIVISQLCVYLHPYVLCIPCLCGFTEWKNTTTVFGDLLYPHQERRDKRAFLQVISSNLFGNYGVYIFFPVAPLLSLHSPDFAFFLGGQKNHVPFTLQQRYLCNHENKPARLTPTSVM